MKFRVALVITLAEHGGAQRHVLDLVHALRAQFEFLVLVGQPGWLVDELKDVGIECSLLPSLGREINGWRDLNAVRELTEAVKRFDPDLLHLHSSKAGLIGRLVALRLGVPVVYTVHGWGFKPGVPIFRRIVVWLTEWIFGCLAQRIVCVSKYDETLGRLALPGMSRRIRMIWNGIPDVPYQSHPRSAGGIRVLMIARFQEPKLQELLIDAVAGMSPLQISNLMFVGDGPRLRVAEAYAQKKGVDASFLGSRDDVPVLLRSVDVCVLLSAYEGLPICIIEAMRAGLPVVASNVGGVPELVIDNETGLLVQNRTGDVSMALTRLAADAKLRSRLGQSARVRYESNFSVNTMTSSLSRVYRDVAGYGALD